MTASRFEDMDEAEARAMYAEWSRRQESARQRLRAVADEFTTARKLSDRAGDVLRRKFAIDPKTGRRLVRRRAAQRDLLG